MDKWDLDEQGNIRVNPLFGYETATVAARLALIRLDYANGEEEWNSRTIHRLQMTLTPTQCRALAQTLFEVAEAVDGRGGEQEHFRSRFEQEPDQG